MKTLEEKLLDFTTVLQEKLKPLVEEKAEELLEEDQDYDNEGTYFICYDTDTVDVGVGSVIIRKDIIQDEEKAEEDAKEAIAVEVANLEDAFYNLLEDNKISSLLADILRSL